MSHPTDESERSYANPLGACAFAVHEAMDFCVQSTNHLDKRARQVDVLAHGFFIGGIKDIPNELLNHAGETAAKTGISAAIGACLSLAVTSKVKLLSVGAKWLGIGMGASALVATTLDLQAKPKLQLALAAAWNAPLSVPASKAVAEKECAQEGFNWGLSLPCAMIGGLGAKSGMNWLAGRRGVRLTGDVAPKGDQLPLTKPRLDDTGRLLMEPSECELSMLKAFIQQAQELVPGVKIDRAVSLPEKAFGKPAVMAKIKLPAGIRQPFEAEHNLKVLASDLSIDNNWLLDCTLEAEDLADMNGSALLLHGLAQ